MAYPEPRQEPYTKYPNRYNDVIKPRLTDTQRDICDVVIRMTYGWHQISAEISNTVFIRKTNKSNGRKAFINMYRWNTTATAEKIKFRLNNDLSVNTWPKKCKELPFPAILLIPQGIHVRIDLPAIN